MRLTAIAVEHFQALIRADVAFGPGLNVIYGPNDFGKSTLAQAIRAALLVVPTSASMSEPFQPWYADAVPHVTLSFEDDNGHHWSVKKGFETSAHSGSAELYQSTDGVTFTLDVKGRQVEERLRAILGWGIAAPGGKGSPRGLPESFLAQTLLAAQTDVDRILGQSLAEDATDSGKVRLGKALATLAQDPLFKRVLDAAQREVDDCYTPTGRRKSGQTSRFAKVGQAVKQYNDQLAQVRKREEEATASAAQVTALRVRQTEHLDAVTKAQATLIHARERLTRWRAREEADARLRAARAALAQIDARARDVALATADVERLSRAQRSADDAHRSAMAENAAADAAFRAAEDDYRRATSEDGARERELRLAQMEAEHASVSSRIQHVETRRTRLNEALAARRVAEDARRSAVVARDELEKATREETRADEQVAHLESTLAGARMLAEYGHWKAAVRSVREATEAAANAARTRSEADAKDRDADGVLAEVQRVDAELAATAARLTTFDRVKALVQLERDLERTEAALGGGLTVVLRPGRAVAVRAVVDQSVVVDDPALASERVLDAERTVRLALGGVLEVDVTAGAAEKRHELATLRARWNAEAVPVFVASGLGSLSAIAEAVETIAADRVRVEASRHRAESLRAQAAELRARAALHDDQAAKLAAATRQLEARQAEIRGADRASLEVRLATLGPAWERETAALCTQANAALAEGRAHAATRKNASSVATYRLHDAEERAARASEAAAALAAHLGTADPDSVASSLAGELATLAGRQSDLADGIGAHTAEATERAQHAAQMVEAARARVAAGAESLAQATRDRERILADRSGRVGHRDALQAQLEAMDRSAAVQKVEDDEGALAVFAADPPTSEADLQAAEARLDGVRRALDDVRSQLNHAEGAWSKVGGMAVAEEVQRLEEAIESARAREQEIEIDAEAYKVLLETLREVENAEGAHLGRALSGPVAARFRDLTEGRYGALNLDAALKTEGVQPAGAGPRDVLDALSVGTREQLATLIRLAIAAQLGSAIVLDDQLVHTDAKRFAWFRDVLRQTCLHTQVIVLTCRPEDYLRPDELPTDTPARDLAGGTIRAIDFARSAQRWTPSPSQSPAPRASQPSQGR